MEKKREAFLVSRVQDSSALVRTLYLKRLNMKLLTRRIIGVFSFSGTQTISGIHKRVSDSIFSF